MSDETSTPAEDAPAETTETDVKDWKAEAEKWQSLARKNEERAKSNASAAKEIEQLREAAKEAENAKLSDIERANKAATDAAARADALAADLARYKVIAATGLPAELHEFLPEGVADEQLLTDRAEKLRAAIGKPPAGPRPDAGQGARPPSPQSDSDALYESIYGPQAQK